MADKELIYKNFDFIENDFGYKKILLTEYEKNEKIVVVYENVHLKKRIEIATSINVDDSHIIIRCLVNERFADYDNKLYCININVLYQIECDNYETDYNFYSFDKSTIYFEKSRAVLLNYKSFLSSSEWIDVLKYIKISDRYYTEKFGLKFCIDKKSICQEFEDELFLSIENVKTLYNSEKQPPYDIVEGINTSKYEINGHLIVFRLLDWRDYNQYDVTIDGIGGYLIDTFTDYKKSIKEIIKEIRRRCY